LNREKSAEHFLFLNKKSRKGKLKIYSGISAGVVYALRGEFSSKNGIAT
jgi:K+-sensing histidine kinase KdpD